MIFLFESINILIERGGWILILIFLTLLSCWTLILERYYFFRYTYPNKARAKQEKWNQINQKENWFAYRIREQIISELSRETKRFLSSINTLVVLFPLFGLLGTITGMIAIFDIMAITGTGNARLMASGISMAVIPTMAGMIAAISGIYFSKHLENKSKKYIESFTEQLRF